MSRRPANPHRHTVPNASYSSFPCFEEELQMKTNLRQRGTSDGATETDNDNFQLNVSMHDKLKMCFAEMETMKDQFDSRRRRLPTKRRSQKEGLPTAGLAPGPSSASDNTHSAQPQKTSHMTQASVPEWESENKFTAHLVRTRSRDSMDGGEKELSKSNDLLSHSPAYEETYVSPTSHILPESVFARSSSASRRAVSDPMGDWRSKGRLSGDRQVFYGVPGSLDAQSTASPIWSDTGAKSRHTGLSQAKNAETRRSYDEWLQKLDQVNDISRSTLKRIRHLESEVTNLKVATDNLSTRQPKSTKTPFASKIPIKVGSSPIYTSALLRNNLTKFCDKSTNTDIDMRSMSELLAIWRSKAGPLMANLTDVPFIDEPSRVTRRRLTTTLGRSVEIQTEAEQTSRQEKGISTEDWGMWPNQNSALFRGLSAYLGSQRTMNGAEKQSNGQQMSILDMPNIETKPDESRTRTHIKTPEPIVEIYSDSEDTSSFDDFEKNIYNQITKRALIKSRLVARRSRAYEENAQRELDQLKQRNSSTQTTLERENASTQPIPSTVPNSGLVSKNLRSTSKIVIERVRMNQKEKSEIVLKTDVDKEGVVHRTTEVKSSKYRPKATSRKQADVATGHREPKHLRKVNSDINMSPSRGPFSRPLSAFDIPNIGLTHKKDDNFIGDKALSSIDIAAKSPISEGYHSEYRDSTNRINTPTSDFVIEPPQSFRNREHQWQEVSKSAVTNKTVNEALQDFKDKAMPNGGLLTLTNETVIDNTGKQTNITTKSRTIRKYKPQGKTKSNLDLSSANQEPYDLQVGKNLCPSQSVSQYHLDQLNSLQPNTFKPHYYEAPRVMSESNQSLVPSTAQCQPAMCNFSLVYNYDNNLVFRANFGLAKLPCFETNL